MENQTQPSIPPFQPTPETPVTPSINWSKIIIFILIGLVVIAGSVFAGMQIGKNQILKQPSIVEQSTIIPTQTIIINPTTALPTKPNPTIDPTANWKTINGKYWIFKVPKEWYFIKCLSGNDIILGPNLSKEFRDIESECNFGIRDLLSVNRTVGEFALPTTTSPDQNGIYTVVSNKKNIMIDNQNAIEQTEEVHGNPIEGTHTVIYIIGNSYTDTLTFWDTNKNTKNELVDQILSTFKFTN